MALYIYFIENGELKVFLPMLKDKRMEMLLEKADSSEEERCLKALGNTSEEISGQYSLEYYHNLESWSLCILIIWVSRETLSI